LDIALVEAEWLCGLLMDFACGWETSNGNTYELWQSNYDSQSEQSKDNVKSSRHVKSRLKFITKLRNSGVISVTYIKKTKTWQIPLKKAIKECDRKYIEGDEFVTRLSCWCGNPTYVIQDPLN
jgi:hypothetical protein